MVFAAPGLTCLMLVSADDELRDEGG